VSSTTLARPSATSGLDRAVARAVRLAATKLRPGMPLKEELEVRRRTISAAAADERLSRCHTSPRLSQPRALRPARRPQRRSPGSKRSAASRLHGVGGRDDAGGEPDPEPPPRRHGDLVRVNVLLPGVLRAMREPPS
jgi:hypothetical protein